MARPSHAVLAALLAMTPALALAQATTDTATPPAATTESPAAATPETAAPDAGTETKAAEPAAADAPATTEPAAPAAETPATDAPAADAPAADAPAQTDAAPAQAAAAEAAPAANATPAPDAAPAGDQVGSYYTKSTHDDWLLRCLKTGDGKDPCELYQLLKDQGDKPVAEVSIIPFTGQAVAIANFVAPLETDLQMALGLQIDAGKNNRYPFLVCAPIGCVSRIGMTEAELGSLKKGSKATVSLLPFGADPAKDLVKLDMSLKGFTAGFTALQEAVKTNQ